MKKIFAIIILCIQSGFCFSQIKIAQHVERIFDEKQKFDSLVNYPGEKVFSLKGQDLYVLPPSDKERGYMGFYESYLPHSSRYKAHSIFTPKDFLENKTFKVIDVKYRKAEYPETPYMGTGLSNEYNLFFRIKM